MQQKLALEVPDIYDRYQWYRSGQLLTNETTHKIGLSQGGSYRVVVDSGECRGISNTITVFREPAAELGNRQQECIAPGQA